MILKKKKISVVISIIYIIWTFYNIFLHYFTFFPIITTIRKSSFCEEIYFSNEMGGYLWHPNDENVDTYKNVLFYFNGMEGNGSSRFNILRKLQQEYSDYTIIQMDYPGFGLSYNISLSLRSLHEECSVVMKEVLTSNPVEKYSCWGEGLGNWVMLSSLENCKIYDPQTIVHYNISFGIFQNLKDKFFIFSHLFIFSYLNTKEITYSYKKRFSEYSPSLYFIYNNDKHKEKRSIESFYKIDNIPFEKKKLIYLHGKGNSSLLMKDNSEQIKNIMI